MKHAFESRALALRSWIVNLKEVRRTMRHESSKLTDSWTTQLLSTYCIAFAMSMLQRTENVLGNVDFFFPIMNCWLWRIEDVALQYWSRTFVINKSAYYANHLVETSQGNGHECFLIQKFLDTSSSLFLSVLPYLTCVSSSSRDKHCHRVIDWKKKEKKKKWKFRAIADGVPSPRCWNFTTRELRVHADRERMTRRIAHE